MAQPEDCPYVSRGGVKLEHALRTFDFDVTGMRCADLGCSTGGFTDCLLQRGAARVTVVDTAYNVLDYTIRIDRRVHVRERENALHAEPGEDGDCDLVVMDLGWTKQRRSLPAAARWLSDPERGWIITLIKPQYEAPRDIFDMHAVKGVLPADIAQQVCDDVIADLPVQGFVAQGVARSPILGSKGKKYGNTEWLALVHRSG